MKFILHPLSFILLTAVPLQDLFACSEENTLLLFQIGKGLLEMLNPMRDAANIRMDRYSHYAGALRAFSIEGFELILGSAEEFFRLVVLKDHHRDIV